MAKRISLAQARIRLSAIVDDVLRESEHYVIERRGRPVAAVVRVEELEQIEGMGRAQRRPRGALAIVGAWGDVRDDEIDAFVRDVYEARARDTGRSVALEP